MSNLKCESCELAKHCRTSYSMSNKRSSNSFDVVHTDVWGPYHIPSMGGYRYFLLFVDDYTRFSWVYLMRSPDEVPALTQIFHQMILTQFGVKIKILRSDNAK